MKKKDIQGLVQRSIQGDKAAFGRVCEAVAKDVLFMCIKIMGHQQDGEDAAQEVFVKMQRSIGSLKNPDVFHIWINRIIISACNDIRRKKVRQKDYVPIEDHLDAIVEDNQDFLPLEYVEDADKKEVLMQVIDSLPEKYRKVVLLYYYEGLSQAGIAQVLEVSVNSVEHTLRRARASIHKKLEEVYGPDVSRRRQGVVAMGFAAFSVLQMEADRLISADLVGSILAASGIAAPGAAAVASGTASAGGTTGATAGGAMGAGKVLAISLACAATIGAAAAAVHFTQAQVPPSTSVVPMSSAVQQNARTEPPQPSVPSEEAEEDLDIYVPESSSDSEIASSSQTSVPSSQSGRTPAVRPDTSHETVPPPSSATQPVSSSTLTVIQTQQGAMVTITGRLLFEDKEGTIREDLTQYAGGARVYLTGKDGKTNSAALMPDGTFRYTGRIWQEGEFTLFYTLPANKGLAFTQDNPEGKIQLDLTFSSGEVTIPAMYVTDTKPPAIELETQDAQGTTTRIDPILVKFNADDASPVSFSWQVRNKQGELLFHGEGEQAALPPEQLPVGKSTETYYIQVTATDAALNQSQLEYYFYRVAP